ncbi:MAG TPA: methyltransferase domain-containing protein [Pyrinomonadaceae bacterium]|jgi:SAM-dependent methyltransferase
MRAGEWRCGLLMIFGGGLLLILMPAIRVGALSRVVPSASLQSKGRRDDAAAARRAAAARTARQQRTGKGLRPPDVIYYATPTDTVNEMLRLADIKPGDVLYDLGSGDGRIPITAAQRYHIRAVGIDINPKLVWVSKERARGAGVSDRVRFLNEDIFRADISEATIVTLYLSRKLNLLLRPRLLSQLRPGTRIISHDFDMGDWKPEQKVRVPWFRGYRTVYMWIVPHQSDVQTSVR